LRWVQLLWYTYQVPWRLVQEFKSWCEVDSETQTAWSSHKPTFI
jgi:hypothetical protein